MALTDPQSALAGAAVLAFLATGALWRLSREWERGWLASESWPLDSFEEAACEQIAVRLRSQTPRAAPDWVPTPALEPVLL